MATSLNLTPDLQANATFVTGRSPAIRLVNKAIAEIAPTSIPVFLVGESGTGKEVYGRLIHRLSQSSNASLTRISCRALEPGELLAELKSFLKSKADAAPGKVQTVFLDGIDELNLACQGALLSALPDGEDEQSHHEQVRLISSASRDLERESQAGRFRKELFFRISGVCVRLPALRERREDIPLFLEHFLTRNSDSTKRQFPPVTQEELALICAHDWPGNIRELENFVRKIVLFGEARDAVAELLSSPRVLSGLSGEPQNISLKAAARAASRQAERELIRQALEKTHWNRKRAARELSISYKSLLCKIKQTGLEG